jgi:hypothetical protein
MAKITHVTRILGNLSEMDEIPSEYIEPYLRTFLMMEIESVGFGFSTPAEARAELKAVEQFFMIFAGLHARYAVMNEYGKFSRMTDEEIIEICKKVCDVK